MAYISATQYYCALYLHCFLSSKLIYPAFGFLHRHFNLSVSKTPFIIFPISSHRPQQKSALPSRASILINRINIMESPSQYN